MRELDLDATPSPPLPVPWRGRCAIVGAGRLGRALAPTLRARGVAVDGPLGRGEPPPGDADLVLLCVPDAELAAAAAAVPAGPLVGHCSGAGRLDALGEREGLSLHPLMTVTGAEAAFAGAGCAIAGSTPRALAVARGLALTLEMRPFAVAEDDRAAYHAAASIASNFLVTLEAAAERLALAVGVDRAALVRLVRATVDNWATLGPRGALTGPIARGDRETERRQRAAVAARAPDLLGLFDALADATRALAAPR